MRIFAQIETAKEHAHRDVAVHCSRGDCPRAKEALTELEKLLLHLRSKDNKLLATAETRCLET